jgi:hypothetical protein
MKKYRLKLIEMFILCNFIHFDLSQGMAFPMLAHSHVLIYDGVFHSNLNFLRD